MAIALAPAIGPVVGGHMHVWFGWRSNFVLLPETLVKPDRHAQRPGRIFGGYYTLLRDGPFMTYTLIMSLVLGGLFAIISEFPFLFIERLGVPTDQYGYCYATIELAFFLGSLAVNRAAGHVNSDKLLAAGWDDAAAGAITITASQCLFAFALGLIFATAPVRAFDVCRAGHGHAAAMLGALPMAVSALGTFCVVLLHDGSAWPAATVFAGAMLVAAALYLYVRPWRVVQTAL